MADNWTAYGDVGGTFPVAGVFIIAGPDAFFGTFVGLGVPGAQIDVWTAETPEPA